MYESFYKLRKSPFSNHPETDSIYFSKKHQAALATLKNSLIDPMGITVLTGATGTGKTTILQYLRSTVTANSRVGIDFIMGFVSNISNISGQLFQGLLASYGLDSPDKSESESYNLMRNYLIKECYEKDRQPYLVIDQAESINTQVIEELGKLSDLSAYRGKRLQFILVGQNELMATLRSPCSEHIERQIGQLYVLKPLDLNETAEYIQYRLDAAGADAKTIFDATGCTRVYKSSKGVPRMINRLCDVALQQGYQYQQRILDKAFVDQALTEAYRSIDADDKDKDLKSLNVRM